MEATKDEKHCLDLQRDFIPFTRWEGQEESKLANSRDQLGSFYLGF